MTRDETVQELSGVVYTRPLDALRAAYDAGAARLAEVEAENERLRGALRPLALVGDLDFGRVSADVRLYSRRSYTRERGDEEVCITVADARRARAALSPVKP